MRALLVAGLASALLLGVAVTGCDKKARNGGGGSGSGSPSTSPSPSPVAPSVVAELASATLADDCEKHAAVTPPAGGAAVASAEAAQEPVRTGSATMTQPTANRVAGPGRAGDMAARGKCAGPNCNFNRPRACQQTTMQLTLTAPDKLPPTSVEVVKIELLDEGTKASLGELTAREPNVWRSDGQYQPWDGHILASDRLNVSYKLTAPDWTTLAGSRAAAAGKSFLMRVTLRIGGQESAVDRVVQSAPLMVEPHVVT
ncbi:MAG: hypothetical protein IT370_28790 [Deltaproteobacteria bacterium]|nr:hypothetical protein [Deltaproteobacteria bacterium]